MEVFTVQSQYKKTVPQTVSEPFQKWGKVEKLVWTQFKRLKNKFIGI